MIKPIPSTMSVNASTAAKAVTEPRLPRFLRFAIVLIGLDPPEMLQINSYCGISEPTMGSTSPALNLYPVKPGTGTGNLTSIIVTTVTEPTPLAG